MDPFTQELVTLVKLVSVTNYHKEAAAFAP